MNRNISQLSTQLLRGEGKTAGRLQAWLPSTVVLVWLQFKGPNSERLPAANGKHALLCWAVLKGHHRNTGLGNRPALTATYSGSRCPMLSDGTALHGETGYGYGNHSCPDTL